MRNHEVTTVQTLLKKDGTLREPGWSRQQVQVYDRSAIKAPAYRIKEWDYYLPISLTSLLVLPDTPKSHNPFTHISPSFHPL